MAITFPVMFLVGLNLPLYGVITCITYAMMTGQSTEATDCVGVPEFLPSVSMVIGSQPQEPFWKALIAVSTPMRIGLAVLYLRHSSMRLSALVFVFHMFELASLLVLSYVSSTMDFAIHSAAFYAFGGTSMIVMALNALQGNRTPFACWSERAALLAKRACLCVYMVLLCGAYYLYTRHCSYCEPYSYSYFAICEYSIVITNSVFHTGALLDFWHWQIACRPEAASRKRERERERNGYTLLIEQHASLEHDDYTKE